MALNYNSRRIPFLAEFLVAQFYFFINTQLYIYSNVDISSHSLCGGKTNDLCDYKHGHGMSGPERTLLCFFRLSLLLTELKNRALQGPV